MNTNSNDHAYMAEALLLAEQGIFTTRTNPRVGCLIVKDNQVIGSGFHACPGHAHAEIMALNNIHGSVENATVYVTLEPCTHHGKTPPCSESLAAAKVGRVVVAMQDPNPLVNGNGLKYLQDRGIATTSNVLDSHAAELNKGFIQRMKLGRPYITIKSAISVDGKTALSSGESQWISCDASRRDVQKLRARSCAIMTGIGTILQDNPRLNVRLSNIDLGITQKFKQPIRVILDTHLRISPQAKVLHPHEEVIIYTCSDNSKKLLALKELNIEVVKTDLENDYVDLRSVMTDLGKRGINELLVESGPALIGSLLDNHLADEIIIYLASHIIGNDGRGLANISPINSMKNRIEMQLCQLRKVGQDVKLFYKPQYN